MKEPKNKQNPRMTDNVMTEIKMNGRQYIIAYKQTYIINSTVNISAHAGSHWVGSRLIQKKIKQWNILIACRYQEVRVVIPLIGLTSPHFCVCPKPGSGFLTSHVVVFFVFSELRWNWWNCWKLEWPQLPHLTWWFRIPLRQDVLDTTLC